MAKMKFETPDMTAENIEKIAELFPNCVTEMRDENGKIKRGINFEMLKQMLSSDVVDGDECYEFTWVGKKASIVEANKPIRKTLRPCPEESKNWDTTENLYIEGDNLEVLKLLQESYLGKVKMIYIDPPYNTGNDFIYADDFMRSQEKENEQMGMYDEDENRLFKNTDSNGRFHSDWCSMMYSRLMLARNLLSDDGVIFISIDDAELYNLKKICDEIFGAENFICNFIRKNKAGSGHDSSHIAIEYDYVLCYVKAISTCKINQEKVDVESDDKYKYEDQYVDWRGKYYLRDLDYRGSYSEGLDYPIETPEGTIIYSGGQFGRPNTWRWSKQKFEWGKENGFIVFQKRDGKWKVYIKQYQFVDNNDEIYIRTIPYRALIDFSNGLGSTECSELLGSNVFSYPKPSALVKHFLQVASDKDSIILDFFSGSATTAHAVMQLNAEDGGHRKFIMVQLPELCDEKSEAFKADCKNICEIGKKRIRRAGEKIKENINALRPVSDEITDYERATGQVRIARTQGNGTTGQLNYAANASETFVDIGTGKRTTHEYEESNPKDYYRFHPEDLDVGFRVLKLDDSNMKDVYYAADDYDQRSLLDMVSNIKDDRNDLDLLFGCLLDWGLPLSLPYKSEQIEGCAVHTYNDGDLIACFDANIPESVVRAIAARKPLRAVFRDSGFADSPAKINVFEIFKLYIPEDADDISKRVRVI